MNINMTDHNNKATEQQPIYTSFAGPASLQDSKIPYLFSHRSKIQILPLFLHSCDWDHPHSKTQTNNKLPTTSSTAAVCSGKHTPPTRAATLPTPQTYYLLQSLFPLLPPSPVVPSSSPSAPSRPQLSIPLHKLPL